MRTATNKFVIVGMLVVFLFFGFHLRVEAQLTPDSTDVPSEASFIKNTFVVGPHTNETKTIYERKPSLFTRKIWNVVYDEKGNFLRSTDGKGHLLKTTMIDGREVIRGTGTPDLVQTFDHGKLAKEYLLHTKCFVTNTYGVDGARTEITYYPNGQKFIERYDTQGKAVKSGFEPQP